MNAEQITQAAKARRDELVGQIAPFLQEIEQLNVFLGNGNTNGYQSRNQRLQAKGSMSDWGRRAVEAHPDGIRVTEAKRWIIQQNGNPGINTSSLRVGLACMAKDGTIRRISYGLYAPADGAETS